MSQHSDEIINNFIPNPPEGMSTDTSSHISNEDLLYKDYLLNEDDGFGKNFSKVEIFYFF